MTANGPINLDGRYDTWARQPANRNNPLREGQVVQLRSRDGTWTQPMTITGLRNIGNGTYSMKMRDRQGQEWTLTITMQRQQTPAQPSSNMVQRRPEYDNRVAQWIYNKISIPMHANPDATLKWTLAISLGIATLPLTGAGTALKMAWRSAVTNGWKGITSLALRTGLNFDTLRTAANASRKGNNGQAALMILTTQINRFKTAGTLTANLPFVRNAIQKLANRFPGLAKQCTQLMRDVESSRKVMSNPSVMNVVTRKTPQEAFKAFYEHSKARPNERDVFRYDTSSGNMIKMGGPELTGRALPTSNNTVYYQWISGVLRPL
jgi:hypothetical protein